MLLCLEILTWTQFFLFIISIFLPKPGEKWIKIARWNPEISYYSALISQTLFPVVEIIIIAVLLFSPKYKVYDLKGPLVFALFLSIGVIF